MLAVRFRLCARYGEKFVSEIDIGPFELSGFAAAQAGEEEEE